MHAHLSMHACLDMCTLAGLAAAAAAAAAAPSPRLGGRTCLQAMAIKQVSNACTHEYVHLLPGTAPAATAPGAWVAARATVRCWRQHGYMYSDMVPLIAHIPDRLTRAVMCEVVSQKASKDLRAHVRDCALMYAALPAMSGTLKTCACDMGQRAREAAPGGPDEYPGAHAQRTSHTL